MTGSVLGFGRCFDKLSMTELAFCHVEPALCHVEPQAKHLPAVFILWKPLPYLLKHVFQCELRVLSMTEPISGIGGCFTAFSMTEWVLGIGRCFTAFSMTEPVSGIGRCFTAFSMTEWGLGIGGCFAPQALLMERFKVQDSAKKTKVQSKILVTILVEKKTSILAVLPTPLLEQPIQKPLKKAKKSE